MWHPYHARDTSVTYHVTHCIFICSVTRLSTHLQCNNIKHRYLPRDRFFTSHDTLMHLDVPCDTCMFTSCLIFLSCILITWHVVVIYRLTFFSFILIYHVTRFFHLPRHLYNESQSTMWHICHTVIMHLYPCDTLIYCPLPCDTLVMKLNLPCGTFVTPLSCIFINHVTYLSTVIYRDTLIHIYHLARLSCLPCSSFKYLYLPSVTLI